MSDITWTAEGDYRDILYAKTEGIAKITINRPERRNAFTPLTVEEMMHAPRRRAPRPPGGGDHPHRPGRPRLLLGR